MLIPSFQSLQRLPISTVVRDPTQKVSLRSGCINKLWTSGDPDAASYLVLLLEDKDLDIRYFAAQALGWLSEDTEICAPEYRRMKIRSGCETNLRVKEALKKAIEAVEENKQEPKLETSDDPVAQMFIRLDDDMQDDALPFLDGFPFSLPQLPFGGDLLASIQVIGSEVSDDDTANMPTFPMGLLGGGPGENISCVEMGELTEHFEFLKLLIAKNTIENRKEVIRKLIAVVKKVRDGHEKRFDKILIQAFQRVFSILPEEKSRELNELIDENFPDDVQMLKEYGIYRSCET